MTKLNWQRTTRRLVVEKPSRLDLMTDEFLAKHKATVPFAAARRRRRRGKVEIIVCAVCGRKASGDHVVTRWLNDDGTLRAFWFCSQSHVDAWKSDNPFPPR